MKPFRHPASHQNSESKFVKQQQQQQQQQTALRLEKERKKVVVERGEIQL
jgi:hypothetical protein